MKAVIFFMIIMLGFGFSGCGSAKRVEVAQKAVPKWYEHPPRSTNSELYGVGEGKSKKEAIDNALSLIASTLSVSISSSYSAKTVIKEGRVNSSDATYVNQTHRDVKKIRIINYRVLNAAQLGFKRFAVLVEVNKEELFRGLKNELDQEFATIAAKEKNIEHENALLQLAFYKRSLQNLKNMQNNLAVMKVLDEKFDTASYRNKQNLLERKYHKLLSKITFWVDADKNAKRFVTVVEAGITKQRFMLKKKKDIYGFRIYITAKIKKAEAYGFSIARSEIAFVTKDHKGEVIGSNVLHIDGQSSQGYRIAEQDLVKKLNNRVKEEGIFKILNLNIY